MPHLYCKRVLEKYGRWERAKIRKMGKDNSTKSIQFSKLYNQTFSSYGLLIFQDIKVPTIRLYGNINYNKRYVNKTIN